MARREYPLVPGIRQQFTPDENSAPGLVLRELACRFWERVTVTEDGCWHWGKSKSSYTLFSVLHQPLLAHRIAYELFVGPIPDGLEIDHLCRNSRCCNPAHLEPVTTRENAARRVAYQTHCKHGHPFAGDNLAISPKGWRICLTCKRAEKKRRRARDAARRAASQVA